MSHASPTQEVPLSGGAIQWLRTVCRDSLQDVRANCYFYVPVLFIWALALVRVFVDPTPHLPILFNWTSSLPYTVAVMQYGKKEPFKAGDFVIYAFEGEAQRMYPGLRGQPLFKQIRGIPGDRITLIGREVFVNGVSAGIAKTRTLDGHPLEPIAETVIPPGFYYVRGTNPNSFDSRYRASGLVAERQIIGKVKPLF